MQIAIVGLGRLRARRPSSTRSPAATPRPAGSAGWSSTSGVVKVPDARLDRLAEIFKPKKIVHADVTYVDLPAPPASSEGRVGTEELPAEHLARLRDADALLHVVRAWDDPAHPHPAGSVDAWRDLEQLDLEFILADLAMVDRRLERLRGERPPRHAGRARGERARGGDPRARSSGPRGGPPDPRRRRSTPDEEKALRGFRFLTQKPVLVLLNVGEGDLAGARRRSWPRSRAATTTATRSSTRSRRRSRWSSASSTPRRPPSSRRSSGSPSPAWTG